MILEGEKKNASGVLVNFVVIEFLIFFFLFFGGVTFYFLIWVMVITVVCSHFKMSLSCTLISCP